MTKAASIETPVSVGAPAIDAERRHRAHLGRGLTRCCCGCGQKVPRSLRWVNERARWLRHARRDLLGMIDSGLRSRRAEQFIGVITRTEPVLVAAIHDQRPLDGDQAGRSGNVLVLYEGLFADQAVVRAARLTGMSETGAAAQIQDGRWDPFSDEFLGRALGVAPAEFDAILRDHT
jgi:hypothetical protein